MKVYIHFLGNVFFSAVLSLLIFGQAKAQGDVIDYVTNGGQSYQARIVRVSGGNFQFRHTKMSTGAVHYDDYIDYISDGGEWWRATLQSSNGALYFRHCRLPDLKTCHNDNIMNIKTFSYGCKRIAFAGIEGDVQHLTQTAIDCKGGGRSGGGGNKPPVRQGPVPYMCTNCGKEMGRCSGGYTGERHVFCSSPNGSCRCRHCNKEYYLIDHTHGL